MFNKAYAVLCFISLILVLGIMCSLVYASQPTSIRIVEDGRSQVVIVLENHASKQLADSAKTLAEYLKRSTGAYFDITDKPTRSIIKIKLTTATSNALKDPSGITIKDAFKIDFPDNKTICLCGSGDIGTEFAVYDFLERYLGVRWLFPGEIGTHVPSHKTVDIPIKVIYEKPRYLMRRFGDLRKKEEIQWSVRNRRYDVGIKYAHNLANLFPPKVYGASNPELYPILEGKRFIPKDGNKIGWQPCFSEPKLVDIAIKNIINYFDENPSEISYSLGVNDRSGHCECERCQAGHRGRKNFLGQLSHSDRYYSWANKVVEGVLKKHPDKWFGCLVYNAVSDPPTNFKLHPRIIPFITYDRMKWVDPDIEVNSKRLHDAWMKKATVLGWYDYVYGRFYRVPRIYFHKTADYLRYGAEHGVHFQCAETYPNWGEGPKLYLYLRLLWNPDLNPDEVLKDWYISAVGVEAAPFLSQYFEFWEKYWTIRVPHTNWFISKGLYLPFSQTGYLKEITQKDLDLCRKLLEIARSKSMTSEQKRRADYFYENFVFYEKNLKHIRKESLL